jgi:hypothetical protein
MFRYGSSSSAAESFLENRLATVSEMIQSFSALTIARCFLSDGNRARTGARLVERFTERRSKDNRRGHHDCAISLASRYAARRSSWIRHLGNSKQTGQSNRADSIFCASRGNHSSARLHQENQENSRRRQSFGSVTQKCIPQKRLTQGTNIAEAALRISSSKRDYSRMFKPQRLNELSR